MSTDKPRVTIYTDGGADPNPGPGGWAAVLIHDATGTTKELSGGEQATTNNRMELRAAIEGLSALTQPCEVMLYTDSTYLYEGITQHIGSWMAKGFKNVKNVDLWQQLLVVVAGHDIHWQWVKGHAGNRHNERADALASSEIQRLGSEDAQKSEVEIYLVVSASPRYKIWAASIRYGGEESLIVGEDPEATANQLHILSAVKALHTLPDGISVRIYTTSDYLRNGAMQWLNGWKRRGWRTAGGNPVKNREFWQALDANLQSRSVIWPSVKDDQAFEMAFEDLAQRAQDEYQDRLAASGYLDEE
nr:ribonuclease HI [Anaerolineae bacterium]